ncbi:hypothetical protein JK165_06940 [Acetobacter okinawensis]|uniref:hypothetical protein n=1 Tax=Acetobacter okinawensis TaxID=1076594 RepID=UPI001BABA887|nr:hypothetical protein [Acetobacter okinawensis]MBS0965829.1 hypothetical protein [Acetobacter okinawensis]
MCSDYATAGALGGIRGSLRRVANDLEQQNHAVSALAQQTQVANHWQNKAFDLQRLLAKWEAWGKDNLEGWKKEEQVSDDLRAQLAQAQEALRVEKKLRDDEFNQRVEKYNKLVRDFNKLAQCVNTVKAQPGNAVALITALEAEMKAQQA